MYEIRDGSDRQRIGQDHCKKKSYLPRPDFLPEGKKKRIGSDHYPFLLQLLTSAAKRVGLGDPDPPLVPFYFPHFCLGFLFVCWNEALTACSDPCRSAGCRIWWRQCSWEKWKSPGQSQKPRPRGTKRPSSRQRPPSVRRAVRGRLCPGEQRPPGPERVGRWGMGDDVWRGQTDGSVALNFLIFLFLFCFV